MPAGRPTTYTIEIADTVCEQIADGKSMRTICKPDDMPAMSSIFKWLRIHSEFTDQYEKAKLEQAEAFTEEMVDIADDKSGDTQRDRLRVDTRKWIASKLKPKKYGDRTTTEHTGNIGISDLSSEELDRRLARLEQLKLQSESD